MARKQSESDTAGLHDETGHERPDAVQGRQHRGADVAAQERDYVAAAMRTIDATDRDKVGVWLEALRRSSCMRGIEAWDSRTIGGLLCPLRSLAVETNRLCRWRRLFWCHQRGLTGRLFSQLVRWRWHFEGGPRVPIDA
ncbi:hypothetical protein V500_03118 [Pseudogymnoascus sp. VKM F-4518 (FW-2643)]|nr:hypothetical protein V500_03118 [Pseudogymnoascus sp. VKM F-4518 (FW-2643)]